MLSFDRTDKGVRESLSVVDYDEFWDVVWQPVEALISGLSESTSPCEDASKALILIEGLLLNPDMPIYGICQELGGLILKMAAHFPKCWPVFLDHFDRMLDQDTVPPNWQNALETACWERVQQWSTVEQLADMLTYPNVQKTFGDMTDDYHC